MSNETVATAPRPARSRGRRDKSRLSHRVITRCTHELYKGRSYPDAVGKRGADRLGRRSALSVVDQVLSSASNFLVVLLVARGAHSAATFGAFTVAFTVLTFVMTMGRSVLGVPLGTDLHLLDQVETRIFIGRSVACALALGTSVSLVLLVADGLLSDLDHDLRAGIVVLAVAAPVVTAQDVGRYVAVAARRPAIALRSDAAWLVIIGSALAIELATTWHPTIVAVLLTWGVGAAVALGLLLPVLARPLFSRLYNWLRHDERRGHLFLDSLLAAGAPLLIALSVTAFASAAVLGSLRGASTLLSPLNIAITAVGLALVPDAARRDEQGARRLMGLASGLLIAGTLVWALLLLTLPERVGVAMLGTIWAPAHYVLPVAAIEYVGLAAWTGAGSYLRAHRQTLLQLRFRYLYSGLGVLAALCATWIWGTPRPIAGATAAAAVCVGLASWARIITARSAAPASAPSR
jgi:O-antigen/teichoic acid export membrane protein